jgi:hypothetical protein
MKKLPPKEVIEVEDEGLISLLGKEVTLFCINYIYTGILEGVNSTCVKLSKPAIVFETGAFDNTKFSDAQPLPHDIYVTTQAIESFGLLKFRLSSSK